MRFRALVALLAGSALTVPAALAHEPPQPNVGGLSHTCEESPLAAPDDDSFNGRVCRNAGEWSRLSGDVCRDSAGDVPCGHVDGRSIAEESVAEYEASWIHRALAAQRALDDDVPLVQGLWPHTHNSYNSSWYDTRIANSDPNQLYSLVHQLRMDMRILELDIHWHAGQVVLCHGEALGPVHAGCSADRTLGDGLTEIRSWLGSNPNEVIGIYLENKLDDDRAAYAAAVAALSNELGSLVYKPANHQCDALPATSVSRSDIRNSGARVFLVGNRDPQLGVWCEWVHERDQHSTWWESSSGFGTDFPAYPECIGYLAERTDGKPWVRLYEDGTWLSQMANGGGEVTAVETERMVSCGVTMPGFDHLDPHDESRLGALVWSFAPGDAISGCAYQGRDGRLQTGSCGSPRPFACLSLTGAWFTTWASGPHSGGDRACNAKGGAYVAPWNGLERNELARVARDEVWVAFIA